MRQTNRVSSNHHGRGYFMRCQYFSCGAELYTTDNHCGKRGTPRPASPSTYASPEIRQTDGDLFPLYGVTLGVTTVDQLTRLGTRATNIDKETGQPHRYYQIAGINFWY